MSTRLQRLAKLLYPECVGTGLDSHRSHIVHYVANGNPRNDTGLSYHYDNTEVTLNVALGKTFADGELYFGEMKDVSTHVHVYHRTCMYVHVCRSL